MRDRDIIEAELIDISAITDDLVKFERIVAWSVAHPDEMPVALHLLMNQKSETPQSVRQPSSET